MSSPLTSLGLSSASGLILLPTWKGKSNSHSEALNLFCINFAAEEVCRLLFSKADQFVTFPMEHDMSSTCNLNQQVVILTVDDDQDNLMLLGYQLSLLLPCAVISATDGHSALLLAKQSRPDLIFLDIMLPDIDGFEIVSQLRQDPQTQKIPVIAVTAMARLQDQETAFRAGYDDYLLKPYEIESLETLIYRYLNMAYPLSS